MRITDICLIPLTLGMIERSMIGLRVRVTIKRQAEFLEVAFAATTSLLPFVLRLTAAWDRPLSTSTPARKTRVGRIARRELRRSVRRRLRRKPDQFFGNVGEATNPQRCPGRRIAWPGGMVGWMSSTDGQSTRQCHRMTLDTWPQRTSRVI